MRVQMLKTENVVLDAVNIKNYPADWRGEVDDARAVEWIRSGSAVAIDADAGKPIELTNDEKAVLKGAAQAILSGMQQPDETVDPETGEITDGASGGPQSPAEVLASMTWPELKKLAKQHEITATKRVDIEAALLAKIGG